MTEPVARRVALVSGGSRGVGRAVCLALAASGLDVAINYRRDEAAANDTADRARGLGVTARIYQAAVEDPDQDEQMVRQLLEDFGRADVFVHSAGNASRGNTVVDTDPAELGRLFNTHAAGAHHLCRLLVRRCAGSRVVTSC
jgi:3-oxoacyl-[acyl-carrier protein] reductase